MNRRTEIVLGRSRKKNALILTGNRTRQKEQLFSLQFWRDHFGEKLDISDCLIPAHVFGNMWGQSWSTLAELVKPFPSANKFDENQFLKDQNYTVIDMFKSSNDFYKSMGLIPNDISYNTSAGAMIERPTDGREVVCHASAWDFYDGENYSNGLSLGASKPWTEVLEVMTGDKKPNAAALLEYFNPLYEFLKKT